MSEYRKTDNDLRGEGKVSSGANVKFTGITKPKGPTSEELKYAQGQDTKEIEDLKRTIQAKYKENTDLKNTVAQHGQQITGLQQQLNDAKRELEETQKKLKEEAITTIPQLSQQRDTFNNQIQKLKDELKDAQTHIDPSTEEVDNIRGELEKKKSELEAKNKEIQSLKNKNADLEQKCHEAFSRLDENDKITGIQKKEHKSKIEQKEETLNRLRKEMSMLKVSGDSDKDTIERMKTLELEKKNKEFQSLKNKIADLEQKCHDAFSRLDENDKITVIQKKEHKSKIEQKEETINKLRKEVSMLKISGDGDKDTKEKIEKLEDDLGKTKESLNTMTREKAKLLKKIESRGGDHERELMAEVESLKSRLLLLVGAHLMDNYPNIPDISDENRPTKLGEKYCELYYNEWTDCYEELENSGKAEQQCINYLMNMLLTVSKSCTELSVKQMSQLKATALSVPGKENKRPSNTEIRVTQQRQLKELRKAFARDTVSPVVEQCKAELNINFSSKPSEEKYFKACVELCWFMNVQDPPVILQAPPKPGLKFDGDSYRSYTRTGKTVDFPVWPTMLLHENGPILIKGVVQGK